MNRSRRYAVDLRPILTRIKANIGVLLGGSGLVMALNFATAAINARAIGAHGLGVIALFQASVLIVIGLFSFGTQQPVIKIGKEALERADQERLGNTCSIAFMLDLAGALLAGSIALGIVTLIPSSVGIDSSLTFAAQIYTVVIFFSGVTAATGVLRLFNRFHLLSAAQVIGAAALLAVASVFSLTEAPLASYLIANALVYASTSFAQVALAVRVLRQNHTPLRVRANGIARTGLAREFLSYAWTTNLTGVINSIRTNAEPIILGSLFGASTVGVYNVIRQVAGAFNKVSMAASSAIFPEVAELASRGELYAARRLLNRLALAGLLLGVCGVLAMALVGRAALEVGFGAEFLTGFPALLLMGVAGALTLSSASFGGFVQAFSSPVRLLAIYACAFLVYSVSAPVLIYNFGLNGAPLSQVAFVLAHWFGCWWVLKRALPQRP